MSKKYEYKLNQTVLGKVREKEGIIIGESSAAAFRELSDKVNQKATGFSIVVKRIP